MKLEVVLKNGKSFTGIYNEDHTVTTASFSSTTIHSIILDGGGKLITTGDQISYFHNKGGN